MLKRWLIALGVALALVVGVLIGVLFRGGDSSGTVLSEDLEREPEDPELGMGRPDIGEPDEEDGERDDEGSDQDDGLPEVGEGDLEAMLEPREPECPVAEGEEERHLQWTEAPPMCIDEGSSYTATLVTSRGEIEIELDVENTPTTVNNFVFLARWGYYDGTEFHRVFPDDSVHGGLPLGARVGEVTDPGYTVEDELPDEGDAVCPRYSVAMGNTGEPDTVGAVFFIALADDETQLDPFYSRFGEITYDHSRSVVDAIEDTGRRQPGGDGTPSEVTVIHEVVITESP